MEYKDLKGERFGMITVIGLNRRSGKRTYWDWLCDCGNRKSSRSDRLLSGEQLKCHDCIMRERIANRPSWKYCPQCQLKKDRSSFHTSKNTSDGLYGKCRQCSAANGRTLRMKYLNRPSSEIIRPASKACVTCKETKPSDDYWEDKGRDDGLAKKCKVCATEYFRRHHAENKHKFRQARNMQSRYNRHGINKERYDTMFKNQAGACCICIKPFKDSRDTHIDHDHKTGAVRSLLCSACNTAIGHFKEDVEVMERAIAYIKRFAA